MISIISFWDKILHFVSPMLLTAVGYGIAAFLLKKTKYADVSPWLFYYLGLHLQGFVASSGNSGNLSAIH